MKAGDEVILPAYTYSATANVIMHCGAKPVFVDVRPDDFNIASEAIAAAITPRTKVVMPVDFAGMPCDYDTILSVLDNAKVLFLGETEEQKQLGRILLLSDAAHSFGAEYKGKKTGVLADVSVFSFHAVKNLTTAEGGAVALNLPEPFDNAALYSKLCITTLHGQNKDALAKTQKGNWRYDIVEAGYKCNMTDLSAAIGLIELARYDLDTLVRRSAICLKYSELLSADSRLQLPLFETGDRKSSFHLYPLRIKNITEEQRDAIIREMFDADISVNVHFIPVTSMSFYKNLGYRTDDFPVTYNNYSREMSLPVFYDLTEMQIKLIADTVLKAVQKIC